MAGMVLDFLVEFDWEVEEEVEEEVALDELVVGRGRRRDIVWWWWYMEWEQNFVVSSQQYF